MHKSSPPFGLVASAVLAAGISTLLAYNVPPSSTVLNQALALVGWGVFVAVLGVTGTLDRLRIDRGLISLLIALLVLALASAIAPSWIAEPTSLAWSAIGTLVVAAALVLVGAAAAASRGAPSAFSAIAWAWLVAGVLSLAVGSVQLFAPDSTGGDWIAAASLVGRAVGNLRQPNHLSSLLLWTAISVIWLAETRALWRAAAITIYAFVIAGIVMSASRTGLVGAVLLTLWGLFDKGLSRGSRRLLLISPLIYIAVWLGLVAWAHITGHIFAGEGRLTADGDLSSSRFAIWSNTLQLIVHHPWFGVGFGGFNFVWSLTEFPHRPVAFFDHTHNILLQFIVEMGLPLGTLVLLLLAYALWRGFTAAKEAEGPMAGTLRASFMMVLMMVLHSQLEYPLWYTYFLLPTALMAGLCLGRPPRDAETAVVQYRSPRVAWSFVAVGVLVAASGIFVLFDYMRVVAIFSPTENAAPLEERIARGQQSWFFSHHADYAAVTTAAHPSEQMSAFKGATHYLLDTRLMLAWAQAYAELGDLDRARFIAQRLREFHNPKSDDFFAECDANDELAEKRPFQCDPPGKVMSYRDFR